MPEFKTVTCIKLYLLYLNPMVGRAEDRSLAAVSDEFEKLLNFYNESLDPNPQRDSSGYYHTFKEDSPLYWLNPQPFSAPGLNSLGQGVDVDWVDVEALPEIKNRYFFI